MHLIVIKLKRKIFFLINKLISIFNLELREKHYSNEKILSFLIKNQKPVIFDIGANIGQSIEKYRKLFSKSIIYSFEPSPEIYKILKKKFIDNEEIYIINQAIGSEESEQEFFINERSHNSGFFKLEDGFKPKNFPDEKMKYINTIKIKKNTIDNFVDENSISRIDILKIDTEGFEEEVLKGARKSFSSKIINFIELELIIGNVYKNKSFSFYDLESKINSFGFKLYSISKSGNLFQSKYLTLNLLYKRYE
tara:strand:- start:1025 stop:1777 length:753 start_codon:yes stop_codon:yes gene_type:complete